MLTLLAVLLILCLVSMLGEIWEKNCHQKCGIRLFSSFFIRKYHPWCHTLFMRNESLECEINVSLRYYYSFYRYHTQKLYQKLQKFRVFTTHLYHVAFQLKRTFLSLGVTTVFLMQMGKLVWINSYSYQSAFREKYLYQ